MKKDPNNNEIKIFFYCLEFKIEKTLKQKKKFQKHFFFWK